MKERIERILMIVGAVAVVLGVFFGIFFWGAAWDRGLKQEKAPVVPAVAPPVTVTVTPTPTPAPAPPQPQVIVIQPQPQQPAQIVINNTNNPSVPAASSASASPAYELLNGDFEGRVYDSGGWYLSRFKELTIDHFWGSAGPNGRADNFSVIWKGSFSVATTGDYYFKVVSDGGVRLLIDDYLIIDKQSLASQSVVEHEAKVNLAAGPHKIALEYYETTGEATVRLFYRRN